MADGDRQLAFTTGPLPVSVQVSGADKLTPKTVNASFDGTGAAGDFLPCLIITGRTGHEVARIPAPQVAAGASAEVSWFPRVGGQATAAGVSGKLGHYLAGPQLIPSGTTTLMSFTFNSGDPLLNLSLPTKPTFINDGIYILEATFFPSALPAAAGKVSMTRLAVLNDFGFPQHFAGVQAPMDASTFGAVMSPSLPWIATAGQQVNVAIDQNTGGALNYNGGLNVLRIA